jgi:hypothetical protein
VATSTTTQIRRELLGPPGVDGYLHIVEDRRDEPRPADQRLADRQPRLFHVRAVLSKGYTHHETIRASITADEGGCFITAPDDIRINAPGGVYEVTRNARGELAIVSRSLTASWYEDAFDIFVSDLTPSLDHLSYLSNTPIRIDILECRDDSNHITAVSYRTPYPSTVLSQGQSAMAKPLFPVFALYREGLNAESNFYRFLCFHKIIEGGFLQIRPQLFRMAREQGLSIISRQDVVPEDPELRRFQPGYIGRRIRDLYDREFQEEYRHGVAHFVLKDGTISNPSSHTESGRFASIVFLLQVCAREVIHNLEEQFSSFFSHGGHL